MPATHLPPNNQYFSLFDSLAWFPRTHWADCRHSAHCPLFLIRTARPKENFARKRVTDLLLEQMNLSSIIFLGGSARTHRADMPFFL